MSAEETEQQAAQWLARVDRGLRDDEALRLDAWLEESTLNRVAWLRLKANWDRAERLAALKGLPQSSPRETAWSRPRMLLALAACLAVLAGGAAAVAGGRCPYLLDASFRYPPLLAVAAAPALMHPAAASAVFCAVDVGVARCAEGCARGVVGARGRGFAFHKKHDPAPRPPPLPPRPCLQSVPDSAGIPLPSLQIPPRPRLAPAGLPFEPCGRRCGRARLCRRSGCRPGGVELCRPGQRRD